MVLFFFFIKSPHSIVKSRDLLPNEVLFLESSKRALTIGLLFAILLWKPIIKGAIGIWKGKEITLAQSEQYNSDTKLKEIG